MFFPATSTDTSVSVRSRVRDRRFHRRYVIPLKARYELSYEPRVRHEGSGEVIDISSGGVLFRAPDSPPVGAGVRLSIHWPALLHGICPLKLVIEGRVVRQDDKGIAVTLLRHQFRTRPRSAAVLASQA